MTIQTAPVLNTAMSREDLVKTNYANETFNAKLKAEQKIVSKNKLEEADFLNLLITQLKNQDPTKPMEDKEFIGQMAQFTSLKQMNEMSDSIKNMAKEFSFSKAVGLVNKSISWQTNSGQMMEGIVNSIKVRNGEAFLNVNGMEIALSQVEGIREGGAMNEALSSVTATSKPEKAQTSYSDAVMNTEVEALQKELQGEIERENALFERATEE